MVSGKGVRTWGWGFQNLVQGEHPKSIAGLVKPLRGFVLRAEGAVEGS